MMRNHFILFSIIYIFLKAESETQKVYMCIAIRVHVWESMYVMAGTFTKHAFDHGQWSLSQIEDICQNEKAPNDLKF